MEIIMGAVFVGVPVAALFIAMWIYYRRKQPAVAQLGNIVTGDMAGGDMIVIKGKNGQGIGGGRGGSAKVSGTGVAIGGDGGNGGMRGSKAISETSNVILAVQRPRAPATPVKVTRVKPREPEYKPNSYSSPVAAPSSCYSSSYKSSSSSFSDD